MTIASIKKRLDKIKLAIDITNSDIEYLLIKVDIEDSTDSGNYIKYKGIDKLVKVENDTEFLKLWKSDKSNLKIEVEFEDD